MGRRNSELEQMATLDWAQNYAPSSRHLDPSSLGCIKSAFEQELRSYFSLSALSRSGTAPRQVVSSALRRVFRVRTQLEGAIVASLEASLGEAAMPPRVVFEGNFYGVSKKQGVSVRFALAGCQPTRLCAGACYAHDALDASPNAVIRGALNHFTATLYQREERTRKSIREALKRHTRRAVNAAIGEAESQPGNWTREPRIRFAHVGEAAAYPAFSNDLARQVLDQSSGRVRCVVYTRHKSAHLLDPDLFIINFTLDRSSEKRRNWIPREARPVFSAFGGKVSSEVEVNFLEHHRWSHVDPIGTGAVCPVTLPASQARTCDAAMCDACFRRPIAEGGAL